MTPLWTLRPEEGEATGGTSSLLRMSRVSTLHTVGVRKTLPGWRGNVRRAMLSGQSYISVPTGGRTSKESERVRKQEQRCGRGNGRSRNGGQKEGSEATLGCGVPVGQERQDFGL